MQFFMEQQAQLEAGTQTGDDTSLWGTNVTEKHVWQKLDLLHLSTLLGESL